MNNRRFWMIFLLAAGSLSALLVTVRFLIPLTASVLSMPVTLVLVLVAAFGSIGSFVLARTIKQVDTARHKQPEPTTHQDGVTLPGLECRLWVTPRLSFPANLNPLLALKTDLKKGQIAFTDAQTLKVSVREWMAQQVIGEIALSEIRGFSCELHTARRQLLNKLLDVLRWGMVTGLIMGVLVLIQRHGTGVLSLLGFLALALGIGIAAALLVSIPNLLRIRTLDLFTLKLRDGTQWEFGVPREQSENAIQTLNSFGIERAL